MRICSDCRRELPIDDFGFIHSASHLVRERTVVHFHHPRCFDCRLALMEILARHELYSLTLHRFAKKLSISSRSGSRARKLACLIGPDDLIEMFVRQKGLCAISAVPMELESGTGGIKNPLAMSVDRIDSDGNYTPDNIQLVCAAINFMKQEMTMDQFVQWCARVAIYQARKLESPSAI